MVQIYHNPNFERDGVTDSISSWTSCVHVANVRTEDLNEAYALTHNSSINLNRVELIKPGNIRPTSDGDVLIHNNQIYLVQPFGFRAIEEWELIPDDARATPRIIKVEIIDTRNSFEIPLSSWEGYKQFIDDHGGKIKILNEDTVKRNLSLLSNQLGAYREYPYVMYIDMFSPRFEHDPVDVKGRYAKFILIGTETIFQEPIENYVHNTLKEEALEWKQLSHKNFLKPGEEITEMINTSPAVEKNNDVVKINTVSKKKNFRFRM